MAGRVPLRGPKPDTAASRRCESSGRRQCRGSAARPANQWPAAFRCAALNQIPLQVVAAKAVGEGSVAGDAVGADQVGERLLHGHHAIGAAYGYLAAKLVVVTLADQGAGGIVGDQDFGGGAAADAVPFWDEFLRADGGQG